MQTLNTFFNTQKDSREWANNLEQTQGYTRARQIISQELTGFTIPDTFSELLIRKFCDALNIKIADILVGGWKKRKELVKYRIMENPESGFHQVTLLEHTLQSRHSPAMQVIVNGKPQIKIKFDITLKLKIDGGRLFIKDGMIFKATTGACQGSGTVSYEGFVILKKETASYDLPGTIPFDPPIII